VLPKANIRSAQAPFVALCAQRRSAKQVKQSKQFIAQPAMTVNDLIKGLIANDPDRTSIDIPVREFQNQNEVARFAKALSRNKHVDEFVFKFFDRHSDDNGNSSLNWDPFLQKLAAHKGLDLVKISGAPSLGLLPLFRDRFFQALQQNPSVQHLHLRIEFSGDNSEGIISFLQNAPSLTEVALQDCSTRGSTDSEDGVPNFATALTRNSRVESLCLESCSPDLVCPILHSLASPDSTSRLTTLVYESTMRDPFQSARDDETSKKSIAEALRQYLESDSGASLRNLDLNRVNFGCRSGSLILDGLSRNTTVNHLGLFDCEIECPEDPSSEDECEDESDDKSEDESDLLDEATQVQKLANIVRTKPGLTSLRFSNAHFWNKEVFADAVAEALVRREPPLRKLWANVGILESEISFCMYRDCFRDLMEAVTNSAHLESLVIEYVAEDELLDLLVEAIPLLKVKELAVLSLMGRADDEDKESMLEAVKGNFCIQKMVCTLEHSGDPWFSDAQQAQLELYLNRNRKRGQHSQKRKRP